MKKNLIFLFTALLLSLAACNDDDTQTPAAPVAMSFANASANLTEPQSTVTILFASAAPQDGTIILSLTNNGVVYGTDYSTTPAAASGTLAIPFTAGAISATFVVNRLMEGITNQVKNVVFTITGASISYSVTGNAAFQGNFNETASLGTQISALVGGPNQPDQVYIDLSSQGAANAPRTSWDLGFYSGADFRVVLNSSLKMSAKQLATTNIDEIATPDDTMLINQGQGSVSQIDDPSGNINSTAIAAVSATDSDNKVYLINLGNGPAATTPAIGAEGAGAGAHRGWKKIRVLRNGNDYKIQYADISATTHQEVTISKNPSYNHTFFSLTANTTVPVEPQKYLWDIAFTPFTNVVGGVTPYFYADFVLTNTKGGARSYQVLTSDFAYDNFAKANIVEGNFTNDQRNIGSNWRSTSAMGPGGVPVSQFVLKTDRFYVIKDPAGNYYKLKFTGGANQNGERGYPVFEYTLLQ